MDLYRYVSNNPNNSVDVSGLTGLGGTLDPSTMMPEITVVMTAGAAMMAEATAAFQAGVAATMATASVASAASAALGVGAIAIGATVVIGLTIDLMASGIAIYEAQQDSMRLDWQLQQLKMAQSAAAMVATELYVERSREQIQAELEDAKDRMADATYEWQSKYDSSVAQGKGGGLTYSVEGTEQYIAQLAAEIAKLLAELARAETEMESSTQDGGDGPETD